MILTHGDNVLAVLMPVTARADALLDVVPGAASGEGALLKFGLGAEVELGLRVTHAAGGGGVPLGVSGTVGGGGGGRSESEKGGDEHVMEFFVSSDEREGAFCRLRKVVRAVVQGNRSQSYV